MVVGSHGRLSHTGHFRARVATSIYGVEGFGYPKSLSLFTIRVSVAVHNDSGIPGDLFIEVTARAISCLALSSFKVRSVSPGRITST